MNISNVIQLPIFQLQLNTEEEDYKIDCLITIFVDCNLLQKIAKPGELIHLNVFHTEIIKKSDCTAL